jgi:hypothetical protein
LTLNCREKQTTPRDLNRARQAESLLIAEYTNLKKLLVIVREKRSILQDRVNYDRQT